MFNPCPSDSQPTALTADRVLKFVLCSSPNLLMALGGGHESPCCATFLSLYPAYSVRSNHTFNLVPLLAGQLHTVHAQNASALLLKSHTHCSTKSLSSFVHTPLPQNSIKSVTVMSVASLHLPRCSLWFFCRIDSLSLSVTLQVGNWHYSYGHATCCMCVACISPTSYIFPSHFCPVSGGFLPWEGRELLRCNFWLLSL